MQPKRGHISGTFKRKNSEINVKLPLIAFEEDGSKIVYCPALDVSGYGRTDDEANESFAISLESFLSYSINKGTFLEELQKLGWKVKSMNQQLMRPPDMSKLLCKNENFSRIFNNHAFRKYDQQIKIPID